MYLLDTNIVSDARRGSREVTEWMANVDLDALFLSVMTTGEIMHGVVHRQKRDPRAAGRLAEWLQMLRREYADHILPITEEISLEWGRIGAIRPRGDADGLIAATAKVHDLILVTRNVADFEDTGVALINPWAL